MSNQTKKIFNDLEKEIIKIIESQKKICQNVSH